MEDTALRTSPEALEDALARRLGPQVGVAVVTLEGTPEGLFPVEAAAVAHAVPRRQHEFAWGRTAARMAMRQLGAPAQPVPSGADRAPQWPTGLVGSISHCRSGCVALVARRSQVAALGVDVEDEDVVDRELWAMLFTAREQAALWVLPADARGPMATRLFSAKEAFYKWQYPLTGTVLAFQDVELEWQAGANRFSVACARLAGSPGGHASGQWLCDGQRVVSWLMTRSGHGG